MLRKAVRRKACRDIKPGLSTRNEKQHAPGDNSTKDLSHDVGQNLPRRKTSAGTQPDRYRGIEMATGDVTDRISHGDDGQAERNRHAEQSDSNIRKCSGENRGAATTENQPERAEELRTQRFHKYSSQKSFRFEMAD